MALFASINGFESGALHGLTTNGAGLSVISTDKRSGTYCLDITKTADADFWALLGDPNQTGARTAGHDSYGELRFYLKILAWPSQPDASACIAALISPAAAGNVDNGEHSYAVTFVTDDGETTGESAATAFSNVVTVVDKTVNGKVVLTLIPLGGVSVTSRKIYRTAAGGSIYKLLATIANNNDVTYTDNIADASLGVTAPSTSTATSYSGVAGWNNVRSADTSYVAMEVNSAGQFRVNTRGTVSDWSTSELPLDTFFPVVVAIYIHNCTTALSADDKCYGEVAANGLTAGRISVDSIASVGSFAFDIRTPFLGDVATESTSHMLFDDVVILCDTGLNDCGATHTQEPPDAILDGGASTSVTTVVLPTSTQIVPFPITGQGASANFSGSYTLVDEVPFTLSGTDHQTSTVDEDTTTFTHDTAYNLGIASIKAIRVIAAAKASAGAAHAIMWAGAEQAVTLITTYTVAGSVFATVYGDQTNTDFNSREYGFRNKTGATVNLAGIIGEVLCVSYYGRIKKDSIQIQDVLDSAPNTCTFQVYGDRPRNRYLVRIGVDATTGALAADIHGVMVAPGTIDTANLTFKGTITTVEQSFELRPDQASQIVWTVTAIDATWLLDRRRPYGHFELVSISTIVTQLITKFAPSFTLTNLEAGLPTVSIDFDRSMTFRECLTALARAASTADAIVNWWIDYEDDLHFNSGETGNEPDDLVDASATLLIGPPLTSTRTMDQYRNRIYVRGSQHAAGIDIQAPVEPPNGVIQLGQDTGGSIVTSVGDWFAYALVYVTDDGSVAPVDYYNQGIAVTFGTTTAFTLGTDANPLTTFPIPTSLDARVVSVAIYRAKAATEDGLLTATFLLIDTIDNGITGYTDTTAVGTTEKPQFNNTASIFVQVDDLAAQAALRQIEQEEGDTTSDGIREAYISDPSLITNAMATARGEADLAIFAREIETMSFPTLDPNVRSGQTIVADIDELDIHTSLKIQDVKIDHVAYSPRLREKRLATATTFKYDFDDFMRNVSLGGGGGTGGSTGAGTVTAAGGASGAAVTAERLATPRTINGVSFDGSANITVTAAAGTLTGATLAANVLASSLTSVGTLTGGATGAGFTVALSTSTITGDLAFANLTQGSALSVLGVAGNATADHASIAAASDHQVLRRLGTALGFGSINLAQSAAVTGTLPVGNGGTNATSFTSGRVVFFDGTSLTGDADLTFVTDTLSATKVAMSSLTSGRVPFASTAGLLVDDADMMFTTDTLSVTKLLAPTSVSSPSLISTAAITMTPASGSGVSIVLATTGDFAVNTSMLCVDTSTGRVGVGTAAPAGEFHVISEESSPIFFDVYIAGSSQGATIRGRKGRGTIAAPRRALSGDTLIGVNGIGAYAADDATDATTPTAATGNFTFAAAENFTSTAQGTIFQLRTTPIGSVTSAQRLMVSDVGNLKIAGTATRATTEGTNHLDIFDGTAPVGTLANGCSFYSTSGEMRVMDAAGNATLLSPHDPVTGEWIYLCKNTVSGKVLRVDLERLVRALDARFRLNCVHEWTEGADA